MSKSKADKARRAQKSRQRAAEKAKKNRPGRLAARAAEQAALKKRTKVSSVPDITDTEYVFWLCHGVNYLASDYETGQWTPVFDTIYEPTFALADDTTPNLPSAEEIAQAVMSRYADVVEDDAAWALTAKAVMAWTVVDKAVVRIYAHEARRRLLAADPTCDVEKLVRQPHQPTVWAVFQVVKAKLKSSASSPSTIEAATGDGGSAPLDTELPADAVPEQP